MTLLDSGLLFWSHPVYIYTVQKWPIVCGVGR